MKKLFFSFILLVSIPVVAGVRVYYEFQCNDDLYQDTFDLGSDHLSHTIKCANDKEINLILIEEGDHSADLELRIHDNDTEIADIIITAQYGEETKLSCPEPYISALISLLVNPLECNNK